MLPGRRQIDKPDGQSACLRASLGQPQRAASRRASVQSGADSLSALEPAKLAKRLPKSSFFIQVPTSPLHTFTLLLSFTDFVIFHRTIVKYLPNTEFAFSGSSSFRPTQNQLRPENQHTSTWIHRRIIAVLSFGVLYSLESSHSQCQDHQISFQVSPHTSLPIRKTETLLKQIFDISLSYSTLSSTSQWAPISEMAATSPLNNNREIANDKNNPRPTPEPELDLLDYSEEMTRGTSSVPPPQNGFGNLGSSLPPINEDDMRLQAQGAQPSELGISPALINSRATSLALETMSNRSTPVPRPIERQTFAVHTNTATGLQIQSPTPRQLNPTLVPAMDQTPVPDGQEDIIVDNEQLETIINLFNNQWLMFVQAREHQNVPMMRFALQQAIGSQEVIRNLAGGEEMLRICENWIAREELADLERAERNNPTPQVQRLAITQRAHSHTISPSPAPLPLTRQTSEITYLGRGQQLSQEQLPTQRPQTAQSQHSVRGNHLPPPPPPSTQPPPASAYYHQHRQGQHHPYYRQGGSQHQQQYPQQIVPNYEQHHQAQVAQTHEPQQRRFHPAPRGNWRGYGRNHRDPTTRLLQVGDYLMRAERVAGRVFRYRGRGRGRNQVQRQGNPQEEPHQ
ncbi:hypothetical protein PGTUg99_011953 [Puccinia graminis f. sp. tritici]|uniref:Uncharacterized protein n=1 Tax=Puccinia graminis f. sp. tritici TaxID=56615 RepID=A0A5B0RVS6_PUCGR|nr:hypothetical protein PGTUg99_011953 [Puccinia graminis f. sp. tritici]